MSRLETAANRYCPMPSLEASHSGCVWILLLFHPILHGLRLLPYRTE